MNTKTLWKWGWKILTYTSNAFYAVWLFLLAFDAEESTEPYKCQRKYRTIQESEKSFFKIIEGNI